jgi:hypothetical protein
MNGSSEDADFSKQAATLSLDRRVGPRITLGAMVGATTTGSLRAYGQSFDLSPGPLFTAAFSYRLLDEGDATPFVLLTASLGLSLVWTKPDNGGAPQAAGPTDVMTSYDGRIGVAAGKTIAHVVTPYALARAFGLPVLWTFQGTSVTGTDVHHYQLGAGVVARFGAFDALVEGVPLGEQAIIGGLGYAF